MKRSLTILLFAGLASCAESNAPPELHVSGLPKDVAQAIVGTWQLASWNNDPVPSLYETQFKWVPDTCNPTTGAGCASGHYEKDWTDEFTGASQITLSDNAQYTRSVVLRRTFTAGGDTTIVQNGSGGYTGSIGSGSVVLQLTGAVEIRATISGNTMTARVAVGLGDSKFTLSDVWVYQRQQ